MWTKIPCPLCVCCWGFPLLSNRGICQNSSYILRQWLGTSLESERSSTASIVRVVISKKNSEEASMCAPQLQPFFNFYFFPFFPALHSTPSYTCCLPPEIPQAWKTARSSPCAQFSSSLWERHTDVHVLFGVHEGRCRNIALCNYWWLWLFHVLHTSQSLHFSGSTRLRSHQISVKEA